MITGTKEAEKILLEQTEIHQHVYKVAKEMPYSSVKNKDVAEYCNFEYEEEIIQKVFEDLEKLGLVFESIGKRWSFIYFRDPLPKIKYELAEYGFILPNGDFYHCEYSGHNNLAADLQNQGVIPKDIYDYYKFPDENSWLKLTGAVLSDCEFLFNFHSEDKRNIYKISKQQIQFIIDYKKSKNQRLFNFNFYSYNIKDIPKMFDAEGNFIGDYLGKC